VIQKQVEDELRKKAQNSRAIDSSKYFQVYAGGYGEGDIFLGVKVPESHKIAKKYYDKTSPKDWQEMLASDIHEVRLVALLMMVLCFGKQESRQKEIFNFYVANLDGVNNWDLVDNSASKIAGAYLFGKDKSVLYKLADSNDLWRQRVSIIATLYFISQNDFDDTFKLAQKLFSHKHDLIHKATGWALREVGKRNDLTLQAFLDKNTTKMPRTMLRYAIEKFPQEIRKRYLEMR
jgi:3-methyladenine DNA glycosylase AlkD